MFIALVAGFLVDAHARDTRRRARTATRATIEPDVSRKLPSTLRDPLPNSIGLFTLRDRCATPLWFSFNHRQRRRDHSDAAFFSTKTRAWLQSFTLISSQLLLSAVSSRIA